MAWRIEGNDIVIDGWENGISKDPFSGIQKMTQVNLAVPGQASVGFPLTASTVSGATLGKPISKCVQFSSGAASAYYILDHTGQVFSATSLTGTWTYLSTGVTLTGAGSTDAIFFWKGYLFKTRGANLDYYSGGSWTNGWQTTLTGTTQHAGLVGRDDVLYMCNGTTVASIIENAGSTFAPGTAASYTFNTAALTLPSFDLAFSMEEQGFNLLIGGTQDTIYVWDRQAPTFNNRIFLAERFVGKMVKANTNVYIFTGGLSVNGNPNGRGRIYVTNGSQADLFFKIPDHLSGYELPHFRWGDAAYYRNQLMFGFETDSNAGAALLTGYGVHSIDLETKAFTNISDADGYAMLILPDQSNSAAAGVPYIVATMASDGTTTAISRSSTTAGTGGQAIILTDLMPVGTYFKRRTFKQIEVKMATPLASGESVLIVPFPDLSSTTSVTFSTAGQFSMQSTVNFQANQWLQFQVGIVGNSATSGARIKEIRVR
jgi:hypothetical protein